MWKLFPEYYLSFIGCAVSILGFLGIDIEKVKIMLNQYPYILKYFFLATAILLFIHGTYRALSQARKNSLESRYVPLLKYVSSPEEVLFVSNEGESLVKAGAGNFTWKELATHFCDKLQLKHLHYSTIGNDYHLVDIQTGKKYPFLIGNNLDTKLSLSGIHNGQVLLLTEK